MAMRDSQRR